MKNIKFELINKEGCVMGTTTATSFATARKNFNQTYCGDYKILKLTGDCESVSVNVRLR